MYLFYSSFFGETVCLIVLYNSFLYSGKVEGSLKCGYYIMVAVPNTNVYLLVLDGGDCPDPAIKCTSVSNVSLLVKKQQRVVYLLTLKIVKMIKTFFQLVSSR